MPLVESLYRHEIGLHLHLSTFEENGQLNTQVFVAVDDIDALYDEFVQAGVACAAPENTNWAQREMSVRDFAGNVPRLPCQSDG